MSRWRPQRAASALQIIATIGMMLLGLAAVCQTTLQKGKGGEGEKENTREVSKTSSSLAPVDSATPVDAAYFENEVRPVLEKNCLGCHGVGNRLAGLDLRSRESALKGGTRGAAFVAGRADKSVLYHLVAGDRAPLMPPTGKLPPAQVAVLKRWIDGGAPWSGGTVANARKQVWWAFKAPILPAVPKLQSTWVRNSVDAFVLAKLRARGLTPSPPAPRYVLIRRAYMDLIGLPPTQEEVAAFVSDRSSNAWGKVIDGLLASPRYGERWGRHWLDLARYADSGGFEGDKDRLLAWRYRDYVIDAFNRDKGYNEFLREQIAGDEIRPDDPTAIIATGYLACGPQDIVENNARTRANELDDLVSTTGSVVLGLTVGCARCHDHKYDPIKQTDYYRLSAIFAPTERREMEAATPVERRRVAEHNAPIDRQLAVLHQQSDPLLQRGQEAAKKAGQANPTSEQIIAALSEADRKQINPLIAQIKDWEGKRLSVPHAMAVTDKGRDFPACHLLLRGDAYHPGEEVKPGFVCALPDGTTDIGAASPTAPTTGRRRALAEWLVSPQNPLTARVWVNRVWRQHFGRGLVNSPSNFGISGELPSHPELLDWLACTFAHNGWKLKPLHRLMLLSSTYQQTSDIRDTAYRADPQDKYYWRMPTRRLEAEAIRDTLLNVAGTLNLAMGGPPVYPPIDPSLRADTFQGPNWQDGEDGPSTWRRSVYVKVKRSTLLPQLEVFDCPEITYTVAQRNVTTTPLQALTLLNDPLILRQAGLFAERLKKECGNDPRKQVDHAYRLAFSRAPTSQEMNLSLAFLQKRGPTGLQDFCHALFNLNEFVYVP
jgi:Protein of unknown function (DUF1553)/Protein of unknown function (DUF1549)/Planctomycete cytochrome C